MAVLLPRRFTVDDYHRMAEAGILTEDDRVELIEGEIVEMSPIGSRHAACVDRLVKLFVEGVKDRAIVRSQSSIHLDQLSEPQPDLALLKPKTDYYAAAHPGPEDILLLVEVADSSVAYDKGTKLPLYAAHGIPEIWLVDLTAVIIDVYRSPAPNGYRQISRVEARQPIPVPGMDFYLTADQITG